MACAACFHELREDVARCGRLPVRTQAHGPTLSSMCLTALKTLSALCSFVAYEGLKGLFGIKKSKTDT